MHGRAGLAGSRAWLRWTAASLAFIRGHFSRMKSHNNRSRLTRPSVYVGLLIYAVPVVRKEQLRGDHELKIG